MPEISASVDGGQSGGSRVRRPGSEDPHWRSRDFSFLLPAVNTILEEVVLGFQIYAWAPKYVKYWDSNPKKKSGTPPNLPTMTYLGGGGTRGVNSKIVVGFQKQK